jgi:hypothetical protein
LPSTTVFYIYLLSRRTCRIFFSFSSLVRTVHCFPFLSCSLLSISVFVLPFVEIIVFCLSVCLPLRLCSRRSFSRDTYEEVKNKQITRTLKSSSIRSLTMGEFSPVAVLQHTFSRASHVRSIRRGKKTFFPFCTAT